MGEANQIMPYPQGKPNIIATAENGTLSDYVKLEGIDIAFIVQATISLCFNVVLLVFISSQKTLRKEKSNQMFINLLHVHIIMAIAGVVAKVYLPDESAVINNGFLMEMFLSLIITSSDRYINIKFPYTYAHLTTNNIILIIMTSWFISGMFVMFSLIFKITPFHSTLVCTVLIITATVTLALTNINIYAIAKRHAAAILKHSSPAKPNGKMKSKVLKSTYVCLAVVMSFIILWLPLLIHNVMVLIKVYKPASGKLFTKIVLHVACFNSLVDPLLYLCFRKNVKQRLRKLFKRNNGSLTFEMKQESVEMMKMMHREK
jgi:hypothetical protein